MTTSETTAVEERLKRGTITEEAVEILRGRIGVLVPTPSAGFELASRDVLINYARSTGDLNPLYRDAAYAAGTRWGELIAYPGLIHYMGEGNGVAPVPMPVDEFRGDPLAGVHGLHAGTEMQFCRPVRVGDTLSVRGGLAGVELKESSMGGRAVHQHEDKVYWDREGNLVGSTRLSVVRVEHAAARKRGRHDDLDVPHIYTPEEVEAIDDAYENEYVRGAEPRYWEDVEVGETSVPLPKGPYTVTAFITQMMGIGLRRNTLFYVHSEAYQYRKKHPKGFPVNHHGIPDTVASVHWEPEAAKRAGVPERYDAGAERVVGVTHAVSNWMGDDAFIRRIKVEVRGFMFVGDLMMITGTVEEKFDRADGVGVRMALVGTNQRGDVIARGDADVLLPSRDRGPVVVPVQPSEPLSIFEAQQPPIGG